MKIVIIRHAEPDYENNTLTEKGFKEAEALGKYYNASMFKEIYCSTLNRAKYTCEAIVKGEKEIHFCDWLQEFKPRVFTNNIWHCSWDYMPSFFDDNEIIQSKDLFEEPVLKEANAKEEYEIVINKFDEELAKNGYVRERNSYKVIKENEDTLLFVCHFGMMSVLLSRLLNIPYSQIAQHTCCYPSGVTLLVSEEREQGIAQFRMLEYSNVEHLRRENLEPSFMGRWAETFSSPERH